MKKSLLIAAAAVLFAFSGCSSKKSSQPSIAVFVPGIMADSATYANLAKGVTNAVEKYNQDKSEDKKALLYILEVGTNQAEWGQKLTALAAEQKYDVIISSNPSLPDLADPVLEQFPDQKFIFLDATREGNPNIMTRSYDQGQQGYVTGYIAGLMSKNHKVALISAQDYPVMQNMIYPSFAQGAADAVSGTTSDYRVVGNWYDATKGAEIADSVAKTGVDVILPICGGAAQGVISSAANNGIHVAWFDANGFTRAPGVVISSTVNHQERLSEEVTAEWLAGKTQWGTAKMVGMKEGYIEFVQDDENYINTVPADVREKMTDLINKILSGEFVVQY